MSGFNLLETDRHNRSGIAFAEGYHVAPGDLGFDPLDIGRHYSLITETKLYGAVLLAVLAGVACGPQTVGKGGGNVTPNPTQRAESTIDAETRVVPSPTVTVVESSPTPKPPEKSPVEHYGAYMPDPNKRETWNLDKMVAIISLPAESSDQSCSEEILVYILDQGTFKMFKGKVVSATDTSFEAVAQDKVWAVKGKKENDKMQVTVEVRGPNNRVDSKYDFDTIYRGSGHASAEETLKRAKQIGRRLSNSRWQDVNIESELRIFKVELPPDSSNAC